MLRQCNKQLLHVTKAAGPHCTTSSLTASTQATDTPNTPVAATHTDLHQSVPTGSSLSHLAWSSDHVISHGGRLSNQGLVALGGHLGQTACRMQVHDCAHLLGQGAAEAPEVQAAVAAAAPVRSSVAASTAVTSSTNIGDAQELPEPRALRSANKHRPQHQARDTHKLQNLCDHCQCQAF